MVCAIGSGKMTALARLLDAGSVLQTTTEEVGHQKLAAQYNGRELRNADEANLLDEEDMHIFGLRPMSDPLDLVCCNACKKPVKASQYAAHAEICKSLSSRDEISLELDGPAVNRKPPRKERKKLPITQTKKATSVREPKKFESVDYDDIAAPESHIDEKIQMSPFAEAKRNMHLNSTHNMNGSRVNPCNVDCSEDVTKRSSKPLKRTAAESPPNPGMKNLCKTTAEVLPYVPAPLATKIYYSQRNHHLRRAICHMFFEESNKEPCSEVPNLEALQVNATPTQTSSCGNSCHEKVANQQVTVGHSVISGYLYVDSHELRSKDGYMLLEHELVEQEPKLNSLLAQRDNNFLHLARTPDQILAARSDFYAGKSGALVPCMDTDAQLPVNNTLGPHYISNSYSFVDQAGSPLSTLQQGSGSVPVV